MIGRTRTLLFLACLLWATLLTPMARAVSDPDLPQPEMTVAKTTKPPVIDGKMAPGEWDCAGAATAFHSRSDKTVPGFGIGRLQTVAWLTYDDTYFYVCLRTFRPEDVTILVKNAREHDDVGVIYDISHEVWVSPPVTPAETYQSLFNTYPCVYDTKFIPSVGHQALGWSAGWEMACHETLDDWVIEMRAPIRSFGMQAVVDGAVWRFLFCTNCWAGYPYGSMRWGPWVGGFKDIGGHPSVHFKENTPVFQLLNVESVFTGNFQFPMAVTGPARGTGRVTTTLRFGPAPTAGKDDFELKQTVEVAAGEHKEFSLAGDLNARGWREGYMELTATTADATRLYHQVARFVVNGWKRSPPKQLKTSPFTTPFGLTAFHAPLSKKLVVKADRYYLPDRDVIAGGEARLIDPDTKQVVVRSPLGPFRNDYAQVLLDLAALKLPLETEAAWADKEKVRKENELIAELNKELKAKGQPELPPRPAPGPVAKEFRAEVSLTGKDGKEQMRTDMPVKLMDYQFEWLDHHLGESDQVIPPWTPLVWRNGILSMWNKSYTLNALGLAEAIVNNGAPQLSGPMTMELSTGGATAVFPRSEPVMKRLTEAGAELEGTTVLGDVAVSVSTRVEFDGFVFNRMTVTPLRPVNVERLSLVVRMPKGEAPCLASTAGFWAGFHGWRPDTWDSREVSSGSRYGNFVPYILLTDSDRGFSWCGDNDRGYLSDPKLPTQEIRTAGDEVSLRVNFISRAGVLDKPTTVEYGWMVTPQKPQPRGWRAANINWFRPYAQTMHFAYADFDRATVWDYYCSPYPKDMAKSRENILLREATGMRGFVGHTGDALGWWRDYKGRDFSPLAADWGTTPGSLGSGEVTRARGPNNYELWHWDKWMREGSLAGVYFDINYLGEEWNYIGGTAYILPHGQIQPGYSYLGQRDYLKRLRYLFHANGKTPPNIWLHTTSGQPVYSWLCDAAMEGENVHATGFDVDYMEALPAARIRAIGMGRNLGCAPLYMVQVAAGSPDLPPKTEPRHFLYEQLLGWLLAHDTLPAFHTTWVPLAKELEIWRDDVRFLPYWKSGLGIRSLTPDIIVSAHVWPQHAGLWVVNTSHEDRNATIEVDWGKLGFAARHTRVFDAETGEAYPVSRGRISLPVPKRMWRLVRLVQPTLLHGDETFVAHFESGEAVADDAMGHRYAWEWNSKAIPKAYAKGKEGLGLDLVRSYAFNTRHHVGAGQGSIRFNLQRPGPAEGMLVALDTPGWFAAVDQVSVQLKGDKLLLFQRNWREEQNPQSKQMQVVHTAKQVATAVLPLAAPGAWGAWELTWQGCRFRLLRDGQELLAGVIDSPALPWTLGRGAYIQDPLVTLGPIPGAVLDDLLMRRQ